MYGDSDTGEDDGYSAPDTDTAHLRAQTGGDSAKKDQLGEHFYDVYWAAKRRWRQFAKRGTRMKRFHRRKFTRGFHRRTGVCVLLLHRLHRHCARTAD